MTIQRISDPGGSIVLEMEDRFDLFGDTKSLEPDPEWRFTDPEGHEHQWQFMRPDISDENPDGASPYLPSLRYVADSETTGHHVCKKCRHPVRPGKRARMLRRALLWDDEKIYRLNGKEIDAELAKAVFRTIQMLCDDSGHVLVDGEAVPLPGSSNVSHDTG